MDKKVDIVVSFDTTGSMYPVISEVKQNVSSFVKDLFASIPNLRIGIVAHGDYCDAEDTYCIRIMDLTDDADKLCDFVNKTERTFGGDADECYELVLNQVRTTVNWRKDSTKALVMIGDASPHGVDYPMNTNHIDWEHEVNELKDSGVKIYAVHALANYRKSSQKFYATAARVTNGVYLTLDNFGDVSSLIKATMLAEYDERKLNEYVSIIRKSDRVSSSLSRNINRLTGVPDVSPGETVEFISKDGLVSVPAGRFQVMEVTEDCVIKDFITSRGVEFKPGRGFYELTKSEKVQQHKEIILEDVKTGELFTGAQVREYLGLKPQTVKGGVTERLSSRDKLDGYRIFIQSTSYNRKLIGGTTFMYEVSDIDDTEIKSEHKLERSGDTEACRTKGKCKNTSKKRKRALSESDCESAPHGACEELRTEKAMCASKDKRNKKNTTKSSKSKGEEHIKSEDISKGDLHCGLGSTTCEAFATLPEIELPSIIDEKVLESVREKVEAWSSVYQNNKEYRIALTLTKTEYNMLKEILK